jgi:beta-galactosidase
MQKITFVVRSFWCKVVCLLLLACCMPGGATASTFTIGPSDFLLDGKPFQIKAGEMHPSRVPHEYWADRLRMIHAMGLNTVSIYTFWNVHEPRKGQFNFTGDADIAQFVRLAQKEGLWVLLRPGPYVCAEWEFGGYPAWLLKDRDMKVRSQDPRFLAAAATYMRKLGEQLAPLQITHGGPILMVQTENEYGSFGSDHVYMQKILDMDRAAGFDVPFFTADGGGAMMAAGHLPDALPGLNGGAGKNIMKEIGKYRPNGPWFVPEEYPGWLDHWGEPHARTGTDGLVRETEWKLNNNVSFCFYMIYGGTNFGFMNGANYGGKFQPQPTSYDYDAPIDEIGRPTAKYFALRKVLAQHLASGETLPDVPNTIPLIEIPTIALNGGASLVDYLSKSTRSETPMGFEDLGQDYGYVLYRTKISGPIEATLKIDQLRDYAVICVDGKRIATLDRRYKQDSVPLKITGAAAQLDILVENSGRINYGSQMISNRKGILGSVTLGDQELRGWEMFKLPFDRVPERVRIARAASSIAPFLTQGTFKLAQVGDTFLDMRSWGKGIVLVNGHNLGRYWHIGPQQTLYCPGVWLKKGQNTIVIFEQIQDGIRPVAGLKAPILDQLKKDENAPAVLAQPEKKPRPTIVRGKMQEPMFAVSMLVKTGALPDSPDEQTVRFSARKARYLVLQALSSHNGDEFTTLAEINVLDAAGKTLPRKNWKVVYVDSEENLAEGDPAEMVFDGDTDTFWHSLWSAPHTSHPHTLVLDLGSEQEITGVRMLPRQDSANGRIKDYKLYLSATL